MSCLNIVINPQEDTPQDGTGQRKTMVYLVESRVLDAFYLLVALPTGLLVQEELFPLPFTKQYVIFRAFRMSTNTITHERNLSYEDGKDGSLREKSSRITAKPLHQRSTCHYAAFERENTA